MEFIRSEVERGLSNGSIKQQIPRQISAPSIPLIDLDLINLNLSSIYKLFEKQFSQPKSHLSTRRIESRPSGRMMISQPLISFSSPTHSSGRFSLSEPLEFSESLQKLIGGLEFDDIRSPSSLSRVSSSKKLNGEEIAETLQAEASFTIATDKKPIVATYGCGPCVALGGYDATNKIAFIVHFSNAGEVRKSGGLIFYNIAKLVKEKITTPIQLHLRGGIEGQSEPIIEAIKIWMKQRKDLPMEIASEDILDSGMGFGKSLSVDSRTGEVSEYDPMSNPKSRGMSDLDAMSALMSAFEPQIKLAYSPK
jgi:hypothetical protein